MKIFLGEKNIIDWLKEILMILMKKIFKDIEIKKIIVIIYINNFFCFVCVDVLINILESNI